MSHAMIPALDPEFADFPMKIVPDGTFQQQHDEFLKASSIHQLSAKPSSRQDEDKHVVPQAQTQLIQQINQTQGATLPFNQSLLNQTQFGNLEKISDLTLNEAGNELGKHISNRTSENGVKILADVVNQSIQDDAQRLQTKPKSQRLLTQKSNKSQTQLISTAIFKKTEGEIAKSIIQSTKLSNTDQLVLQNDQIVPQQLDNNEGDNSVQRQKLQPQDIFPEMQFFKPEEDTDLTLDQVYLDRAYLLQFCPYICQKYPFTQLLSFKLKKLNETQIIFIIRSFLEFAHRLKHFVFNLSDQSISNEFGITRAKAEKIVYSVQEMFQVFVECGDQFQSQMMQSLLVAQKEIEISGKKLLNHSIEYPQQNQGKLQKLYAFLTQAQYQPQLLAKLFVQHLQSDSGLSFSYFAQLFCLSSELKTDKGLTVEDCMHVVAMVFKSNSNSINKTTQEFVKMLANNITKGSTYINFKRFLEIAQEFMTQQFGLAKYAKQQLDIAPETTRILHESQIVQQIPHISDQLQVTIGSNSKLNLNKWDYIEFHEGIRLLLPSILHQLDNSVRIELDKQLLEKAANDGFKEIQAKLIENTTGKVLVNDLYNQLVLFLQNQLQYFDNSDL